MWDPREEIATAIKQPSAMVGARLIRCTAKGKLANASRSCWPKRLSESKKG